MDRDSFEKLSRWFLHAPGKQLLGAESKLLCNLLPRLFGYYLLQLGGPIVNPWLAECRIPHRIHVSTVCPCDNTARSCVQADFVQLPFEPNSIDVVLLPHTLEFMDNPRQILEEAYQVLIPEGYIVILGFQPWSLWGLTRLLKKRNAVPWSGKFYSSLKIREWLSQFGYKVEDHKSLFFRPPLENQNWLSQLFFLEIIGQLLWPYLGGVYLIVAKKRVTSYIPIKSTLFPKRVGVPRGVTQPTARILS
jgi:SAM-dependent methyltransferase